jgi:hypothetical protein
METAQILTTPTFAPVTGLAAGVVNDDPPLQANMVDIAYFAKVQAPVAIEVVIMGEDTTPRALTGAHWFGRHAKLEEMVDLGPVNDGYDVTVSTTRFHREVLPFVAGLYTHLGIGLGTLAASTIALQVYGIEVQG